MFETVVSCVFVEFLTKYSPLVTSNIPPFLHVLQFSVLILKFQLLSVVVDIHPLSVSLS